MRYRGNRVDNYSMSGETQKSVSGWTVDTLATHIRDIHIERDARADARFAAQEKALDTALMALEKASNASFHAAEAATTKAELAAERRFASVNEFRGQLTDQAATFVTRAESEAKHKSTADRIDTLSTSIAEKADVRAKGTDDRLAAMSTLSDGRLAQLNATIAALTSRIDSTEGRSKGITQSMATLLSVLVVVVAITSIVVAVILHAA